MYSKNFSAQAVGFQLTPNTKLFADGGISPDGECWVLPTDLFLRLWNSPGGVAMKEQGFRLGNDGKRIGASQDSVLYLPRREQIRKGDT